MRFLCNIYLISLGSFPLLAIIHRPCRCLKLWRILAQCLAEEYNHP
jgi:hypothetical protein